MIGMLNRGKLAAFGTMQELRKVTRYPYSIKVYSTDFEIDGEKGDFVHLPEGITQIYTHESEVYGIISSLISQKIKFTVQEISLNTIFENIVYGGAKR